MTRNRVGEDIDTTGKPDSIKSGNENVDDAYGVVVRSSDNESKCARCFYGEGQDKPGDCQACVDYAKDLYSRPVDTINHTLSTYLLGEQVFGGLCTTVLATNPYGWIGCQVLGHILGEKFGEWFKGTLAEWGLTDCRDKGPGVEEQTLLLWDSIVEADRQGAHHMGDPAAPAQFWALCVATADIWVNDGLENCRDKDWWTGAQQTFQGNVAAISAASLNRGQAAIQTRAKEIARQALPKVHVVNDKEIRVLETAFAIALAENELQTESQRLRLQNNIAHYAPGTLSPTVDEEQAWQTSASHALMAAKESAADQKADELIEDAKAGTGPFSEGLGWWGPSEGLGWWWLVPIGAAGAAAYLARKPILRTAKKLRKKLRGRK